MSPALFLILTFLAAVTTVVGIYSILCDLFLRDRERVSLRVDEELRQRQRDRAKASVLFKNTGAASMDLGLDNESDAKWWQRFAEMIEQSDLNITARRLVTMMVALGLGLGSDVRDPRSVL